MRKYKVRSKIDQKKITRAINSAFKKRHIKLFKKYNKIWKTIPKIKWAWIAGFWEGEGYISHRKLVNGIDCRMCIVQKDKSILNYIKRLLQTGNIYTNYNKNKRYICYSYRITKLALSHLFLLKIQPFLKSKYRLYQIKKYIKYFPELRIKNAK